MYTCWGWARGLKVVAQCSWVPTRLRASYIIHRAVSVALIRANVAPSHCLSGRRPRGTLARYHTMTNVVYWATLCREMELRPDAIAEAERSPNWARASWRWVCKWLLKGGYAWSSDQRASKDTPRVVWHFRKAQQVKGTTLSKGRAIKKGSKRERSL
jgi:hypothetical protein